MAVTTLSQIKSNYLSALKEAQEETKRNFMVELNKYREICVHVGGVQHLTGVGTRVIFCRHCGVIIDEHIL